MEAKLKATKEQAYESQKRAEDVSEHVHVHLKHLFDVRFADRPSAKYFFWNQTWKELKRRWKNMKGE